MSERCSAEGRRKRGEGRGEREEGRKKKEERGKRKSGKCVEMGAMIKAIEEIMRIKPISWIKAGVYALGIILVYYSALVQMIFHDWAKEDYSHCYLIQPVVVYSPKWVSPLTVLYCKLIMCLRRIHYALNI